MHHAEAPYFDSGIKDAKKKALVLSHVSKCYGAVKVADNISFEVTEGEAIGIIGPNGAGKSTLFNLITGNIFPQAGIVSLFGQDVTRQGASRRVRAGIGRTFQIPKPFEGLSVFENVLVAGSFGRGRKERSIAHGCAEVLAQTELLHLANVEASRLSLLDRKRLEFARAIATRPKLLLLDEIAAGLTEAECLVLVQMIENVRRQGITIIWVEHVLHALMSVVERLAVLNFGKVVALGNSSDVIASKEVRDVYLGAVN